MGFDVENFFRDIDVDDVRHLYSRPNLVVQKSAKRFVKSNFTIDDYCCISFFKIPDPCDRAAPRSKSFYYSFVDSPYFFYLLIEHGKACHQDYKNFMNCVHL